MFLAEHRYQSIGDFRLFARVAAPGAIAHPRPGLVVQKVKDGELVVLRKGRTRTLVSS